jgi:hypothetical protein
MEIASLLKELFANYGAAALPWSVVAYLFWTVYGDKHKTKTVPDDLQRIIDNYHEAIVGNTRAIERLAILLEERTRRQRPS